MRSLLVLLSTWAAGSANGVQEQLDRPFVEYSGDTADYLHRLHTVAGKGAWRADYPGGFYSWRADVEAAMSRVRAVYLHAEASERFELRWGADGHKFYPDLMWPFVEAQLGR